MPEAQSQCFRRATVGFKSFRYDMKELQISSKIGLKSFRMALSKALKAKAVVKAPKVDVLIIHRKEALPRHITNLRRLESLLSCLI